VVDHLEVLVAQAVMTPRLVATELSREIMWAKEEWILTWVSEATDLVSTSSNMSDSAVPSGTYRNLSIVGPTISSGGSTRRSSGMRLLIRLHSLSSRS